MMRAIQIVLTVLLAVFLGMAQAMASDQVTDDPPPEKLASFSDSPFPYLGVGLGCAIIGFPSCIAISGERFAGEAPRFERDPNEWGVQAAYLPSYVHDLAEIVAYQRIEASAYWGNNLVSVTHRRGFKEPNEFSSTSYRFAYSFDWRQLRPAFGFGVRRNVNARFGNAYELWFPIFANRKMFPDHAFSMFLETLWVFGPGAIRPEAQVRFEYGLCPNATFTVSIGYFPDYANPEAEISLGPLIYF